MCQLELHGPKWTAFYVGLVSVLVILCNQHAGAKGSHSGHYKPRFKDTDRNITVGPGDRAVLKCRVENLGTKTVAWKKKSEEHPLTIGMFTFVGDTRISVDYNQRTNEWSLIIQDVRPSDEGKYQCQIATRDTHANTYDVLLNVKTVQVSGTDYVEMGQQIQLICNATGKPEPPHDVEWFKDGEKINSDAQTGILITKKIETKVLISVLVIKKSKMKDDGFYVCRSSNRDTGMIKVHVLNVSTNNVKRGTSIQRSMSGSESTNHRLSQTHIAIIALVSTLCICAIRHV
jgi:hypothetical protein